MSLAERIAKAQGTPTVDPAMNEPQRTAHVRESVQSRLLDDLGARRRETELDSASLEREVRTAVVDVIDADGSSLSTAQRSRLAQQVADDLLGYGPLEALLRDDSISEIMVNGPHRVYVERGGRLHSSPARFIDEAQLRRTIDRIVSRVGRRVDEASPMVDARLPDGSRVNVILPPLSLDGPVLTIRRFGSEPLTINDLVTLGALTPESVEFLASAVRERLNIIVSGATGTGKTTLMNALSAFIPDDERIVTIEDAAELRLQQTHVVRLECRPPNVEGRGGVTIRDLVKNALRMRPDRIVIGEVRDGAALDMLQAMSTGHDGSIGTVHASSPREALARIETMALTAGTELPLRAVRESVVRAIDLVVHLTRERSGLRRVACITEVVGLEGDMVTLQDLFSGRACDGVVALRATGHRSHRLVTEDQPS